MNVDKLNSPKLLIIKYRKYEAQLEEFNNRSFVLLGASRVNLLTFSVPTILRTDQQDFKCPNKFC